MTCNDFRPARRSQAGMTDPKIRYVQSGSGRFH